jgi:hypothetical protein
MVDDCVGMCCQANWGCLDIRLAAELYPNWGFSRKPVLTVHTKPKPENGSIAWKLPLPASAQANAIIQDSGYVQSLHQAGIAVDSSGHQL